MRRSLFSLQLAIAALVVLTTATRGPALVQHRPIDDEAIYSVVANEIVDGGKPYLDAVERKPPLLFYTFAAVYEIGGEYNWVAVHIVALLWTLATMAGLFLIGRSLFDAPTGLVAALLYSLFQPALSFKNLALNGELLMNLPIVWAWAIAFWPGESRMRPGLFIAGALSCVAFLLKQPAAIAAVPLGIYLLLPSYRASRGLTTRDSLFQFAMFVAGFWITLAAMALVLAEQGILRDAFYWTIEDHVPHEFFFGRFLRNTATFLAVTLPLWLGALFVRALWQKRRAEWIALVLLVCASAIGVMAGGRFYSHYYIQLLPALALIAAPLYRRRWSHPFWRTIAAVWLLLTAIGAPAAIAHQFSTVRKSTETGRYLAAHGRSNERLFVWGQEPQIYLQAHMLPASRYITSFALTGYVFGGPIPGLDTHRYIRSGAWENLRRDFAQHPPDYIVDVRQDDQGRPTLYRIADFPVLQQIIARDYVLERRTAEAVIYRRIVCQALEPRKLATGGNSAARRAGT